MEGGRQDKRNVGTQLTRHCSSQAFEELDSFQKANKLLQLSAIFYFVCKTNASPAWAGHRVVVAETKASTLAMRRVDSTFVSAHWG